MLFDDMIEQWGIDVGEIAACLAAEIYSDPAMKRHFGILTPDKGRIEACNLIAKWAIEFEQRTDSRSLRNEPPIEGESTFYEDIDHFLQEKFMELIRRDTRHFGTQPDR